MEHRPLQLAPQARVHQRREGCRGQSVEKHAAAGPLVEAGRHPEPGRWRRPKPRNIAPSSWRGALVVFPASGKKHRPFQFRPELRFPPFDHRAFWLVGDRRRGRSVENAQPLVLWLRPVGRTLAVPASQTRNITPFMLAQDEGVFPDSARVAASSRATMFEEGPLPPDAPNPNPGADDGPSSDDAPLVGPRQGRGAAGQIEA